jgi:hypothetical protein
MNESNHEDTVQKLAVLIKLYQEKRRLLWQAQILLIISMTLNVVIYLLH